MRNFINIVTENRNDVLVEAVNEAILEPTLENLNIVKDFIYKKWIERAKEYHDWEDNIRTKQGNESLPFFPPVDLSDACKFSAYFCSIVFGGRMVGNHDHYYVILPNGERLDLNAEAHDVQNMIASGADPYRVDDIFMRQALNNDRKDVSKRVTEWLNEFCKEQGLSVRFKRMSTGNIRPEKLLKENASGFIKYWWSKEGFDEVETTHADEAMNYFTDIGTGDYDDIVYQIEDEDDANTEYMRIKNSVRCGVSPNHRYAFIDALTKKDALKCAKELSKIYPELQTIDVEVPGTFKQFDLSQDKLLFEEQKEILEEAIIIKADAVSDHDNTVRQVMIHHNPGRHYIKSLIENSKEKCLRGFIDEITGDFYVWDAYITDHAGAAELMKANGFPDVWPRIILEIAGGRIQPFAYIDSGMTEQQWENVPKDELKRAIGDFDWMWS